MLASFLPLIPVANNQWMSEPVVIASDCEGTGYACQRMVIHDGHYFFVFYSNVTYLVYRTSVNGVEWSTPTPIRPCADDKLFSIWYDETYAYYVYTPAELEEGIYYCRGVISGNHIAWGTEYEARSGVADYSISKPVLVVNSDGLPFIGYTYYYNNGWEGTYSVWLSNCPNGDGSGIWTHTKLSSNFKYELITALAPLTKGKVYATYSVPQSGPIYGKLFNGSWSAEEKVAPTSVVKTALSAVNLNDDVHITFVYSDGLSRGIKYVKRTYEIGWSEEETIHSPVESIASLTLTVNSATDEMWCFFILKSTDRVVYLKFTNNQWDDSFRVLHDRTEEDMPVEPSASYLTYSDFIMLVWRENHGGTGAPNNLTFTYFKADSSLPVTPKKPFALPILLIILGLSCIIAMVIIIQKWKRTRASSTRALKG